MSGSEASFSDDGTHDHVSADSAVSEACSTPPEELDALKNDLEARPGDYLGRSIEYSGGEDEAEKD